MCVLELEMMVWSWFKCSDFDLNPFKLRHDFSKNKMDGPESEETVGVVEYGQANEEYEMGCRDGEPNESYHGEKTVHDY